MHRLSNWKFTANCCIPHWNANETRRGSANAIVVADCSDVAISVCVFVDAAAVVVAHCQMRESANSTRYNTKQQQHQKQPQKPQAVAWPIGDLRHTKRDEKRLRKMFQRAVRYATKSKELTACVGVHV